MRKKRKVFKASSLRIVATGESLQDSREPPISIGDLVVLNSGGPASIVVDINEDNITAAWHDGQVTRELSMPKICFHRVRNITGYPVEPKYD